MTLELKIKLSSVVDQKLAYFGLLTGGYGFDVMRPGPKPKPKEIRVARYGLFRQLESGRFEEQVRTPLFGPKARKLSSCHLNLVVQNRYESSWEVGLYAASHLPFRIDSVHFSSRALLLVKDKDMIWRDD